MQLEWQIIIHYNKQMHSDVSNEWRKSTQNETMLLHKKLCHVVLTAMF